jgi:hypothetical protein
MKFNYRAFKVKDMDGDDLYFIAECVYDDDGEFLDHHEAIVMASSLKDLHTEAYKIAECLMKPIIEGNMQDVH